MKEKLKGNENDISDRNIPLSFRSFLAKPEISLY